MSATLKQRFLGMNNFLNAYVEEFICNTGLDETIDFLPVDYTKHKSANEDALYCHPYILGEILQRLKGFIGVNSFTTYTSNSNKQITNTHNFISTFLDVCSVRFVKTSLAKEVIDSDVSYITSDYNLGDIDKVIDHTKNVIIIENINRLELLQILDKHKRHNVISYYHANNTTNPVASIAIVYKDFDMFE